MPDQETTTLAYTRITSASQTVNVATGASETAVTTTKNFDRQGRLISVTEGAGTAHPVTTSYGYDVGSRLSGVSMPGTGGLQTRSFTYDGRGFLTSETHPELGTIGYGSAMHSEYDPRGHAHRTTTGTGFDIRTTFDAAERPTLVTDMANNRTLKQFAYDSGFACTGNTCQGKLAAAARYNYDADLGTVSVTESIQYGGIGGRPSRRDRSVGSSNTSAFSGDSFFSAQTYNALGDLSTLTYPCRSIAGGTCNPADRTPPTVNNGYTNGFLTSVAPSTGTAWASSITYQPTGLVSTVQHGGGVTESWAVDPNGMARPQTISATDSSGAPVWSTGTYLYDGAGNIKQIGAANYVYDVFNRLASWTSGPLTGSYSWAGNGYDTFGNKVSSLFGACGVDGNGNQFCDGQTFPPVAILGTSNHYVAYTYDAAGNVLSDGKRTFAYDPLSMMTRAQVSGRDFRYLYSADDERIAAVERVNGRNRTTWTLRGFDNQLLSDWTDDWTTGTEITTWREDEIRRGSRLLANLSATYGTRHYVLDHLGSPRQIADSNGHVIGSQDFTPFGSGGTSNGGALQFTGHERDQANLGGGTANLLDYMHARHYDTTMGRFLSVDPVLDVEAAMANSQSWNRYSYVTNNPLRFTDPTGKYVCTESHLGNCNVVDEAVKRIHIAENALSKNDPRRAQLHKVVVALGAKGDPTSTISHIYANAVDQNGQPVIPKGQVLGAPGVEKGSIYLSLENALASPRADGSSDRAITLLGGTITHETKHRLQPIFGDLGPPSLLSHFFYENEAYTLENSFFSAFGQPSLQRDATEGALTSATKACEQAGGCVP